MQNVVTIMYHGVTKYIIISFVLFVLSVNYIIGIDLRSVLEMFKY
jgi:hypothetical protein